MSTIEELTKAITVTGDEIRAAKASNASKETIAPLVEQLKDLKEKYATILYIPSKY